MHKTFYYYICWRDAWLFFGNWKPLFQAQIISNPQKIARITQKFLFLFNRHKLYLKNPQNDHFSYNIIKNRSLWASSSGPFLCYEGFHLPHSSGLQEASISRASSMVWPNPLWIHFYGFQLLHHFKYSLVYQLCSSLRLFRFSPTHKYVCPLLYYLLKG